MHRSNTSILEEQPVVHVVPLAATLGVRDLVISIVTLDQVLHNASGFEQVDRLAIRKLVGEGWNTAIGVDSEEPILLLCILADVDLLNFVGKSVIVSVIAPG